MDNAVLEDLLRKNCDGLRRRELRAASLPWLTRNGHSVTVVERSAALRSSGSPVDVRGPAVEVALILDPRDACGL
jgi:hypothetical protein